MCISTFRQFLPYFFSIPFIISYWQELFADSTGYSLFLLHRELLLPEGGSLGAKHDEIRKELVSMCNLGEAIEENALRKGRSQGRKEGKSAGKKEGQKIGRAERLVQNVEAAMKSFHLDLRTACEGLGSSLKENEQAKKLLKG